MNYFFFPLTESEFLENLGVSQIIRDCWPNRIQTLLLPDHPRMRARFSDVIPLYFDKVVKLPYCTFKTNIIKGYKTARVFSRALEKVNFQKRSIIFACGWSSLVHFILSCQVKRIGNPESHLLVSLQSFIGEGMKSALKINLFESIRKSAYTIPICGGITRSYMEPRTNAILWTRYPRIFDVLVNIEHCSPGNGALVFDRLPSPTSLLSADQLRYRSPIKIENNALLVLLNSVLADYGYCDEKSYWQGANQLIRALEKYYPKSKIYIKLHPMSEDNCLNHIESSEVVIIDKETCAEEVYIFNSCQIQGVYSSSSTALVTASWFYIPAYDCSEILGIDRKYLENTKALYEHSKGIVKLSAAKDVLAHANSMTRDRVGSEDRYETWRTLLERLNKIVIDR